MNKSPAFPVIYEDELKRGCISESIDPIYLYEVFPLWDIIKECCPIWLNEFGMTAFWTVVQPEHVRG